MNVLKSSTLILVSICVISFLYSAGAANQAVAENQNLKTRPESTSSGVTVHVRMLRASDPVNGTEQPLQIDKQLEDLRPRLDRLHYHTFKLVGAQNRLINVNRKVTLNLSDGHSLVVRPIYIQKEKAGLWINWKDEDGASILDTRLHLRPGEIILTGTDSNADSGLLLAIDVAER